MTIPGSPFPGYYLIGRGDHKVPARIHRPCHCSINGGEDNKQHDWLDTCDRFPAMVVEIEGRVMEDGHDPVSTAWATAEPLQGKGGLSPAAEYAYRCAMQDHKQKHGGPDLNKMDPIF